MLIRTIHTICILLVAGLGSLSPARAQEPLVGVDGCAILASVVFTEVTRARLGYWSGASGDLLYAGRNEIVLCNQTTRSVTNAFAAALHRANIYVTWGFHTGYSGDYCLSHFLSQCYPSGDPALPPLDDSDRSFLMQSWRAVRDSIDVRTALYPGSDVARFRRGELGRSIRRSILAGAHDNHLQVPVH